MLLAAPRGVEARRGRPWASVAVSPVRAGGRVLRGEERAGRLGHGAIVRRFLLTPLVRFVQNQRMAQTFGACVRTARRAAGLSYEALGALAGLSACYLHDIEHGRRRLPPRHWGAIVAALPSLTLADLAAAFVSAGRIDVDAEILTRRQRAALAALLEAQARAEAA